MLPEELFPSQVFTESFVEQLVAAITFIPSREVGGFSVERVPALLGAQVPGTQQSVRTAVECLEALGLVAAFDGVVARTRAGDKVRKEMVALRASAPIARVVVRSGFMSDQLRALREVLELAESHYFCGRQLARSVAPQLVGLLARLPDVSVGGRLQIGRESCREIDSLWNEVLPSSRIDWADKDLRRKATGDRAESYSMEYERTRRPGALSEVVWASRDDDSLGYDIEIATTPTRRIEVKGSTGPDVFFFLSAREHDVATLHGLGYEIQFWGNIDMSVDPRLDYERLRGLGYPLRVADPVAEFQADPWLIIPDRYRVSASVRVGGAALASYATRKD